jgi:hypothetical protein
VEKTLTNWRLTAVMKHWRAVALDVFLGGHFYTKMNIVTSNVACWGQKRLLILFW